MNIIKTKIHRNLIATIGISVLALLLISNSEVVNQTQEVKADSHLKELMGYAWASNGPEPEEVPNGLSLGDLPPAGVGWISMNCRNTNSCNQSNYKVTLNEETGELTGYAWASNGVSYDNDGNPIANGPGWLRFGELAGEVETSLMPTPTTENGTKQVHARINPETNKLEGWARFLSYGEDVVDECTCEDPGDLYNDNCVWMSDYKATYGQYRYASTLNLSFYEYGGETYVESDGECQYDNDTQTSSCTDPEDIPQSVLINLYNEGESSFTEIPPVSCESNLAWDGWVSLSGNTDDGGSYGPTRDSEDNLSGYAWGDDVVGWIAFDHEFGGVTIEDATAQCGLIDGTVIDEINNKTDAQLCKNGQVEGPVENISSWTWDCIVDDGYGEGDEGSPNDYGCSAQCENDEWICNGVCIPDDEYCDGSCPPDTISDPDNPDQCIPDDPNDEDETPAATIGRFEAVPRIINPGDACILEWGINTPDANLISCSVTSDFDQEQIIQFNPSDASGQINGTESFSGVDATTQYTLTCSDKATGEELDSQTARCSINPNFQEF